jgi:hypothetical protein
MASNAAADSGEGVRVAANTTDQCVVTNTGEGEAWSPGLLWNVTIPWILEKILQRLQKIGVFLFGESGGVFTNR